MTFNRNSGQQSHNQARYLPYGTLGTYRGDTCLETFLSKFENIAQCLQWNDFDWLFHLKTSREGAAGKILWDTGIQTSATDIIRLFRARFRNENQVEILRAKLRARRRHKGASLQSLYKDIFRLLAVAYPGPTNPTTILVGRDMFLEALDNQTLWVQILERESKILEEALNLASRFKAYELTFFPD